MNYLENKSIKVRKLLIPLLLTTILGLANCDEIPIPPPPIPTLPPQSIPTETGKPLPTAIPVIPTVTPWPTKTPNPTPPPTETAEPRPTSMSETDLMSLIDFPEELAVKGELVSFYISRESMNETNQTLPSDQAVHVISADKEVTDKSHDILVNWLENLYEGANEPWTGIITFQGTEQNLPIYWSTSNQRINFLSVTNEELNELYFTVPKRNYIFTEENGSLVFNIQGEVYVATTTTPDPNNSRSANATSHYIDPFIAAEVFAHNAVQSPTIYSYPAIWGTFGCNYPELTGNCTSISVK